MGVVRTIPDKCRRCYACIRNCPAKAIRIQKGQAQVIDERCIVCGTCVRVCSQKAKQVESDTGVVWRLLGKEPAVVAVLSSSFPAAFPEINPRQLVAALKSLGFSEVMEVAFGAELVLRAYHRVVTEDRNKTVIFTSCPAVVDYIEKFYPQLLSKAAPIVSPMIAMGRLIKRKLNPRAKVVFIGSCIAKKAESKDDKVGDVIDAVLAFAEIREMWAARGIVPSTQAEAQFSGPKPNLGRMYSVPGGLLKAADLPVDVMKNEVVVAEGKDQVVEILREFAEGKVKTKFLELLFCEGCINGPVIGSELSFFRKKDMVVTYALSHADPEATERDIAQYIDIDLSRSFSAHYVASPVPSESDIREILIAMDKPDASDELNCGACGYHTCRDLATAIFQGLGEKEMCWPYLLDSLKASQEQLVQAEGRRFYLEHVTRAQEEERKHIARELHDSTAQTLVALLHQLENFLQDRAYLPMSDTRFLWNIREEIRTVLQEVRHFSRDLRPAILDDLGLIPALEWLVGELKKEYGIRIKLAVDGNERRFPTEVELALFRIIQEALRNVGKHSLAPEAQVKLKLDQGRTVVTIEDNGRGFNPPQNLMELSRQGKLGLIGMQERARLLGGCLQVKSELGRGTTIILEVPI